MQSYYVTQCADHAVLKTHKALPVSAFCTFQLKASATWLNQFTSFIKSHQNMLNVVISFFLFSHCFCFVLQIPYEKKKYDTNKKEKQRVSTEEFSRTKL